MGTEISVSRPIWPAGRFVLVVFVFLLVLLEPAFVIAQECPKQVGEWTEGSANGIAVASGFFYFGKDDQLVVADIQDPDRPMITGWAQVGGTILDVAVSGGYAYVGTAGAGLRIFDVRDPKAPTLTGTVDITADVNQVAVSGTYVYVAMTGALAVVQVADPTAPVEVNRVARPGPGLGVAASGNFVYFANRDALWIYDVSSPSSPVEKGYATFFGGSARKVAVSGSMAFVADEMKGLRILDVSDPAKPTTIGSFAGEDRVMDVAVYGARAYLLNAAGGLQAIDVSTPSAPSQVWAYDTPAAANRLALSSTRAYVTLGAGSSDTGGWVTIDVVNAPPPGGAVEQSFIGWPKALAMTPTLALVGEVFSDSAGWKTRFQIFDLSVPWPNGLVGQLALPGRVIALAVEGARAYVATIDDRRLLVLDFHDPSVSRIEGSLALPDNPTAVAVSSGYAYVGSRNSLTVIDVSNPAAPVFVGRLAVPNGVNDVASFGARACVAVGNEFWVLDLSDPIAPVKMGSLTLSDWWLAAVVMDATHAYVANRYDTDNLKIIDISNPTTPVEKGSLTIPSHASEIALRFPYVLFAGTQGLAVVDVSDPYDPRPVTTPPLMGNALSVATNGMVVALGTQLPSRLQLFSVADCCSNYGPPSPFQLLSPDDGALTAGCALRLDWEDSLAASGYDIGLDTVNPPATPAAGNFPASEYTVSLPPFSTYFWKVTAQNGCGTVESAVRFFTTTPGPGPFGLVSPLDGAVVTSGGDVLLDWDDSPFVADYAVYFGATSPPPLYATDLAASEILVQGLPGRDPYYWRVEARNRCATVAAFGGTRDFKLVTIPHVSFSSTDSVCSGSPVTFDDLTTGTSPPFAYEWDFGDGSAESPERNPFHLYAAVGRYTVTLTVTDASGGKSTAQSDVFMMDAHPRAVGNALRALTSGPDVHLLWTRPPGTGIDEASHYAVFAASGRGGVFRFLTSPAGPFGLSWTTTSTTDFVHAGAIDPAAPQGGPLLFYSVVAQNGCGDSRDAPRDQSVEGVLTDPVFVVPSDVWQFWVPAGAEVSIRIDRLDDGGGTSSLDPSADVEGPTGRPLSVTWIQVPCGVPGNCGGDCPSVAFTATTDGDYRLVVRDLCWEAVGTRGTYAIYMTASSPGGALRKVENDD